MTIAMCLVADRHMRRQHIRQALCECGVRDIAEDRDGLFGEFSTSRLYFSHNDTGRTKRGKPRCIQRLRRCASVRMVFHYAPAQLLQGKSDLCLFLEALNRNSGSGYALVMDGQCVWVSGAELNAPSDVTQSNAFSIEKLYI